MSDSIGKITSSYDAFTASEKKVADFIIGNLQEAVRLNIHQLSESTGVSEATIVRFCRRLGFDGFRDFCIQMAQGMSEHDDYVMDINSGNGELADQVSRVLMANMQSIRATLDGIDFELLARAAEILARCRNMLFLGMGTSGVVCQDAALRFLRSGRQAAYHWDYHNAVVAISHFDERDAVIGISHSGATNEVCDSLELARKRGCATIGITTYPRERIGACCDILLKTVTRESPLHKVAITSRTSQLSIIDALFIATLLADYDRALESVLRVSENITSLYKPR